MQLAEAFVSIKADMANFDLSMEAVQKQLNAVGKSMTDTGKNLSKFITAPAMAAGTALFALATKTGDYADDLLTMSDAMGHSTDALQEWDIVARKAGTSQTAVVDASRALTKAMAMGEEGSANLRMATDSLGLSFNDLMKATPDERMNMLIKSLQGVEDMNERIIIGTKLFKGNFEALAPIVGMTTEEMERFKQQGWETGEIMSSEALNSANDFKQAMIDLKMQISGATNQIATAFIPVLKDTVLPLLQDTIVPLMVSFAQKIAAVGEWFNNLNPTVKKIIIVIGGLAIALGPVLIFLGQMAIAIGALLPVIGMVGAAITAFVAGPGLLIVAGIAAVIAAGVALYKHWDELKEFIIEGATAIKDYVVDKFQEMLEFIQNLPEKFKEAGANIMSSIKEGIDSKISDVKDTMSSVAKSIRDYLPFSPAKVGPLKDLDKLNFGIIADSIQGSQSEISSAMGQTAGIIASPQSGKGANIFVELDGRTIAQVMGQHLVNDIRVATGARI